MTDRESQTLPIGRSIAGRAAASSGRTGSLAARQDGFSSLMARAQGAAGREGPGPDAQIQARAREAAEQLVSIALVQPLLAQLRSSNHAAPPFAPSQGEKQFQSMLDAQVSQSIVKASGFGLVDRLAQTMLARSGSGRAMDAPGGLAEAPVPGLTPPAMFGIPAFDNRGGSR